MPDGSSTLLRRRMIAVATAMIIALSSFAVYSTTSASEADARRCANLKTCAYP